eukprot:GHVU01053531.1.p1 GENE.GHVU01053531.1~~GHVU01053531.1.p1  ORF type:complete len:123 (-),score=14.99 GHVU01053531.1:194-562(-)
MNALSMKSNATHYWLTKLFACVRALLLTPELRQARKHPVVYSYWTTAAAAAVAEAAAAPFRARAAAHATCAPPPLPLRGRACVSSRDSTCCCAAVCVSVAAPTVTHSRRMDAAAVHRSHQPT